MHKKSGLRSATGSTNGKSLWIRFSEIGYGRSCWTLLGKSVWIHDPWQQKGGRLGPLNRLRDFDFFSFEWRGKIRRPKLGEMTMRSGHRVATFVMVVCQGKTVVVPETRIDGNPWTEGRPRREKQFQSGEECRFEIRIAVQTSRHGSCEETEQNNKQQLREHRDDEQKIKKSLATKKVSI